MTTVLVALAATAVAAAVVMTVTALVGRRQGRAVVVDVAWGLAFAVAAVAAGVDGLFLECHPDPKNAKSDAATVLNLAAVEPLLRSVKDIADIRSRWT